MKWVRFVFFWSGGYTTTSPRFEEIAPTLVFEAPFDSKQGVGAPRSQILENRAGINQR